MVRRLGINDHVFAHVFCPFLITKNMTFGQMSAFWLCVWALLDNQKTNQFSAPGFPIFRARISNFRARISNFPRPDFRVRIPNPHFAPVFPRPKNLLIAVNWPEKMNLLVAVNRLERSAGITRVLLALPLSELVFGVIESGSGS